MSKPTPGPYTIETCLAGGCELLGSHPTGCKIPMARFFALHTGWEECQANARAWVDGIAALDMVERIRAVRDDWRRDMRGDTGALVAIIKIIDEAKS